MKINGVELQDLDIFDLETAEKYEKVLKDVSNEVSKVNREMGISEAIRIQCNSIFNAFNTLFGEETDKKVFGTKVNLMTCIKAFEELTENVSAQKKEVEKFSQKYKLNREQRRSNK